MQSMVIAIFRGLAGHTPKEAARVIHCSEEEWLRWEAGTSEMHPAFSELYRRKTRHLIDQAARNAAMLVPKFTREHVAGLEFEWPDGSDPIRAVSWAELAAKVAERERQTGKKRPASAQGRRASANDNAPNSEDETEAGDPQAGARRIARWLHQNEAFRKMSTGGLSSQVPADADPMQPGIDAHEAWLVKTARAGVAAARARRAGTSASPDAALSPSGVSTTPSKPDSQS